MSGDLVQLDAHHTHLITDTLAQRIFRGRRRIEAILRM